MVIMEGEYMQYNEEKNAEELTIVDMFRPELNAAAAVTKFKDIKELFRKTYEEIIKGDFKEIA